MSSSVAIEPLWLRVRRDLTGILPEAAAEAVRRSFSSRMPIDVRGILVALGIRLENAADVPWSGALESSEHGATIQVRFADGFLRQRFTLAHELGHLMLHPLGTAFRDHTFSGGWQEVEANHFAACLLMPRDLIQVHVRMNIQAAELAKRFQVSRSAMAVRLGVLGIPNRPDRLSM